MKSTIKIHKYGEYQFVTGTVSIEDIVKENDFLPSGHRRNYIEYCPAPVRLYSTSNSPFKNSSARFQECYKLLPEVAAILKEIDGIPKMLGLDLHPDRLGRVINNLVDPRLHNVKKQETAEKRVREANEELDRWLREDKDKEIRRQLENLLDLIHNAIKKDNDTNIWTISQNFVEGIGNPGFYEPDEKGSEKGDPEIIRIQNELAELRNREQELEHQKLARRRQLCYEWLDSETCIPAEIVTHFREQFEAAKVPTSRLRKF